MGICLVFAGNYGESHSEEMRLAERPDLTARLVLDILQKQYPGEYPDKQLRTLQRRVKECRASALIQFDNAWSGEEQLAGMTLPDPLRPSVGGKVGHPLGRREFGDDCVGQTW